MDGKPDALGDTAAEDTHASDPGSAPTLAGGPSTLSDGVAKPSTRYQLGEVLGRGGMGEVLTAHDEQIGRAVAIKRMRGTPSEVAVARFLREAKIQGRLDHPAIVPVHELCRDDEGRPYFVMKQLTGTTLGDVLGSKDAAVSSKFNRQSLLRAFVDVCLAGEFAHTRGVVHRDLKPANIMLGDFGEVYVLDWGIARLTGDAAERTSVGEIEVEGARTVEGSVLGTPGYMSPEQIRGDDLDGRADVFALGCILYELLAGKALYPHGTAGIALTLQGVEARPSKVADVPPELDEACVRAAASDREQRMASARELADTVRRFLDGDRDLELRRTLARDEMERARVAVGRGNSADDRAEAIRSAGRALALDPHAHEPAELVGRLMLDPPAETPPEVERELTRDETSLTQRQLRSASIAALAYIALLVNCYLAGLKETWFLVSAAVLIAGVLVVVHVAARQAVLWRPLFAFGYVVNCTLIGVIAHGSSPFLIAPLLATLIVTVFASQPKLFPLGWLIAGGAGGVLVPFGLELVGVLESTITFRGGEMVFHPESTGLSALWTLGGLCIGTLVNMSIAGYLVRMGANEHARLVRQVQIQAWHLRQLMPQRS